MFRRLIEMYQRRARRPISRRPRFRPLIEMLENRLAPSVSPLPTHGDLAAVELPQFSLIHVGDAAPGPVSEQPPFIPLQPVRQTVPPLLIHGMIAQPIEANTKFDLPTGTELFDILQSGRPGDVLSPAAMDAYVARNLPTLAKGLPQMQPVVRHMGTLVATVERDVPRYATTRRLPFRGLAWLFLGPGLLLTLLTAADLLGGEGRSVSRSTRPMGLPTAQTT